MTVTKLLSFKTLEDDPSIHHDLTSAIGLPSHWFIALLDIKLMNFIFSFMALGNTFFCG
ncbi:PREDICTED: uncharacterized protein LOC104755345 [Camelina sativa]|uniref:Uncharacterized protein LOC104755345 n=1 Tax=Camelina sativa TaxID=90675 RepID=A0ABM0WTP3_CAMSA|nr:PREDICTED: uncharacterized protein LOC104755345 [Camelina sativa]